MEKPPTQARIPIPLDNENIPDWSTFEATKEKTQSVCAYILLEIEKEEALFEPIHLSMLKRQITIHKGISDDYKRIGPAIRLWLIQEALKRG